MCKQKKVRLEYLPPYSPDFNPIEEAFAELKAWYKRHYAMSEVLESFEDFLASGLLYLAQRAGNHFRSCHVALD